jgi:hypothetical protein
MVQWIDSKLLDIFLQKYGEDAYGLLATYSILLKNRNNGHCYVPIIHSNNKKSVKYRLLSNETGVSYNVLKRNVDTLISEGLCYFTKSGGFFMLGKDSVNTLTKNKNKKRIGIKIGKTLCETKLSVRAVMVLSNIKTQQRKIDSKVALRKLKMALDNNRPLSRKQLQKRKYLEKNGISLEVKNLVQITTLSNNGFAKVLYSKGKEHKNNISKGNYWKEKLIEGNFIRCRRRYKTLWDKSISYQEYLKHKPYFEKTYGYVTYKNGRVVQHIISEIGKYENTTISYYNEYNTTIYNNLYNTKENNSVELNTTLA